jgi:DNA-binding beta-propeller fold protein YncE
MDNTVSRIDLATRQVDRTVTVGYAPGAMLWDSVHNYLYSCAEIDDIVKVVDCGPDTVVMDLATGNQPVGFTWNDDQQKVYVANHLGATVSVINTNLGIEEVGGDGSGATTGAATVVRNALYLPDPAGRDGGSGAVLLDGCGRAVMALGPGANDVRPLAAGIYFVRTRGGSSGRPEPAAVTKVVVER